MSELEFIAREEAKLAAPICKQLRRIRRIGDLDSVAVYGVMRLSRTKQNQTETLLINGLITLTGPSATIPYNHYELTAAGIEYLP